MDQPTKPVRVLVVDDEEDSRILLTEQLTEQDGLVPVGAASSVEEAIELAEVLHPDVALVDWVMPGGGGPKAAADIVASSPGTRVLGISGGEASHASFEMMRGGATGFVSKGCSSEELLDAIRSVMRW